MPVAAARRTARIEARVTPQQKRQIERAAARQGQSIADFIVAAAGRGAVPVPTIKLSAEAIAQITEALRHPKPPNRALSRALRDYQNRIASGKFEILE